VRKLAGLKADTFDKNDLLKLDLVITALLSLTLVHFKLMGGEGQKLLMEADWNAVGTGSPKDLELIWARMFLGGWADMQAELNLYTLLLVVPASAWALERKNNYMSVRGTMGENTRSHFETKAAAHAALRRAARVARAARAAARAPSRVASAAALATSAATAAAAANAGSAAA
jgi:hypothetical protein